MKARPRPYDERSAYARCYGERDGSVRIVKVEAKRPRFEPSVSGEALRQRFEERLAKREPQKDQDASASAGAAAGSGAAAADGAASAAAV